MNQPMYKIEIIMRPRMLEKIKEALNGMGITDMILSQILGCNPVKTAAKPPLNPACTMPLQPKVKLELNASELSKDQIIQTASHILSMDPEKDGRIFVSELYQAIDLHCFEDDADNLDEPPAN